MWFGRFAVGAYLIESSAKFCFRPSPKTRKAARWGRFAKYSSGVADKTLSGPNGIVLPEGIWAKVEDFGEGRAGGPAKSEARWI